MGETDLTTHMSIYNCYITIKIQSSQTAFCRKWIHNPAPNCMHACMHLVIEETGCHHKEVSLATTKIGTLCGAVTCTSSNSIKERCM